MGGRDFITVAWRILWVVIIAVHAGFCVREQFDLRWPSSRESERVLLDAVVDGMPTVTSQGWMFDARATLMREAAKPFNVRVVWPDRGERPRVGERWQLLAKLEPPKAPLNPGAPDRELQLFRDRIHALGTVVPSRLNRRIADGYRPLTSLREHVVETIEARVVDRDAAALISALAVGATGAMSREQWRVFNATGTTHLVAISGLHVTLFALVAMSVARWLWRVVLWRVVRISRETFAAWFGFAASTAYALLAGFSVPTQRTLIMLGVWLIARASARACGPFTTLTGALLAVLLWDPFAVLAAGFWLSFAAISAIILCTTGRVDRRGWMRESVTVQAGVSFALAPVTLAWFGSIGATGVLANAVAIPFFSFVLVPLVLLATVVMTCSAGLSGMLLDTAAVLYDVSWPFLVAAADMPMALLLGSAPIWWCVMAIPAVVSCLMPWSLRVRAACVLGLLPFVIAKPSSPPHGAFELTVLDVGDEPSVLVVRTQRHVVVQGFGNVYRGEYIVQQALLPFLRSVGANGIDLMMLNSGPRAAAGVAALLASIEVRTLTPRCIDGKQWVWDGVIFRMSANCTLSVAASGGSVSMSGKVAVAPGWVLVSGRTKTVAAGANVLATADSGAIQLVIDDRGVHRPVAMRARSDALWRAPP